MNANRSAAAGQRPSRSGYRASGSQLTPVRPVSHATASAAARSSCTRRRLTSPETQRSPGTVIRPSSVTAALYATKGRPSRAHVSQASFWRRDSHAIGAGAFKQGRVPEWPHHGL